MCSICSDYQFPSAYPVLRDIHSNGLYIIYMTYHHVLHHNSNLDALFEYLLYSILWVTIKGWKPSIKTKFFLSYLIFGYSGY